MWWHTHRNQISSFARNGRVHLNRWGRQFSRPLAAEVCASAVVMLDTPCSEVVWRVLAIHCIRQYPFHFPSLRHRVPSHFNWSLLTQICYLLCVHHGYWENQHERPHVVSNGDTQKIKFGTPSIKRNSWTHYFYNILRTVHHNLQCTFIYQQRCTTCTVLIFSHISVLVPTRFGVKPLQPTGHVMHKQCNIQQLYALPTLYLWVLYLSENKQRLVPLTA